MSDLHATPVAWLLDNARGYALLHALQLVVVLWVRHLRYAAALSPSQRVVAYLVSAPLFLAVSATLFDARTHVLGSIAARVVFVFTGPLHAVSYLLHIAPPSASSVISRRAPKPPSTKPFPFTFRQTFVRLTYPAPCRPSTPERYRPRALLLYGAALYVGAALFAPAFLAHSAAHPFALHVATLIVLFVIVAALTSIIAALRGVPFPPFHTPFIAPTQAAFWAGRWNAPISSALRAGVFTPLSHAGTHRAVSVLACFLVSAVAHELLLPAADVPYGASRGHWFAFFLVAGAATAAEKYITRQSRHNNVVIPPIVFRVVGTVFLTSATYLLFTPVLIRYEVLPRILKEMDWVTVFPSLLADSVRHAAF